MTEPLLAALLAAANSGKAPTPAEAAITAADAVEVVAAINGEGNDDGGVEITGGTGEIENPGLLKAPHNPFIANSLLDTKTSVGDNARSFIAADADSAAAAAAAVDGSVVIDAGLGPLR